MRGFQLTAETNKAIARFILSVERQSGNIVGFGFGFTTVRDWLSSLTGE